MFTFMPGTIPHNIFVIGAGGTGGRLLPLLAQFLKTITRGQSPTGWIENPAIWLVDDDVVEQKNLMRQNFIQNDVGKAKAAVLAERYQRAYGTTIHPILRRISSNKGDQNAFYADVLTAHRATRTDSPSQIVDIIESSIVIICVDSAEARRDILNTFMISNSCHHSGRKIFFIDSGNEDNFGQVSFFTPDVNYTPEPYAQWPADSKPPTLVTTKIEVDYSPMNFTYYQNLVDTPAQGSCADLDQTLAINAIMATTIMGIIQNYYFRKEMTYNLISISLNGGSYTAFNSFNDWKSKAIDMAVARNAGGQVAQEKDGRTKGLPFLKHTSLRNLQGLAQELITKMAEEAAEVERAIQKEAKLKRIAEEKERKIKERAEEKRQAKYVLDSDSSVSETKVVIPPEFPKAVPFEWPGPNSYQATTPNANPVDATQVLAAMAELERAVRDGTNIVPVTINIPQVVVAEESFTAPPLVAVPRVRRTVELTAPTAEVLAMGDDNYDDAEDEEDRSDADDD